MSDYMVQESTGDVTVRYSHGAATFHWLTALLVLGQLYVGFTFGEMPKGPERAQWFLVHKTLGATILIVTLLRLGYRLINPPPPYPRDLPKWDRFLAVWSHRIVYAALILLPLTGLIAVSDGAKTGWVKLLWGLQLPAVPGISEATGELSANVHVFLVWSAIVLLSLHVLAAIYHHFLARDVAAGRMPPFPATGPDPVEG